MRRPSARPASPWPAIPNTPPITQKNEFAAHFVIWEYDSLAAFEAYKKRRADYKGPYAEYKKHDPYYMGVFHHQGMKMEFWTDEQRDLWIE